MKHGIQYFRFLVLVIALAGLLVLSAAMAYGQAESGTIGGTVKDASGAVVVGAPVTARNLETSAERSVQTGSLGQYTIPGLTPGHYRVTVVSPNFQTFQTTAEVTVGGTVGVNAQLSVGQSSTVVEVTSGSAATEVNTQTQELSTLIDTQQLAQLPSLTRNPYDFVAISGNVSGADNTTNSSSSSQNSTSRGVGYSINGQRESGTEILLDGVENTAVFGATVGEQVPVDSIQEYSIVTNNFSAEYGRASGGVVNLTTKGGTNSFHGSAWEFNRLSAYTANTYANDAANSAFLAGGGTGPVPSPKGTYTRNQFGFQVGGPIIKNKLFIFESTEWTRVRSSSSQTQEVLDPTFIATLPANVQSYFTANGSGPVAASGTVTAGQLAAAGITVGPINGATVVPPSTPVFDITNFRAPFDAGGDVPQNTYRLVGRLDFTMTNQTQMFFRAGRENENQFLGSASYSAYPQYDVGSANLNQSFLYSLSHSFNPNVFSNTKASFTRFNDKNSFNTALTNTPNLILSNFAVDPVTGTVIQLPGLENVAAGLGGLPFGGPQNTIQLEHDLSWIKGRHAMRFGGQFTYIQLNVAYGAYAQAVELLGNDLQGGMNSLTNVGNNAGGSPLAQFSARVNPNGALPCNRIDGSYVIVPSCTVTPPLGPAAYARSYRYKDWATYAQDSFRVTPRLTLNYGLRYEHYGVQHNNNQSLDSNFYFGPGASIPEKIQSGQVFLTQKSPVGQFWAPTWGTAAPRVGFAYDVFGDGKTSLRGGFGMSYERNFGNVTFNASFNPPASAVISENCGATAGVITGCASLATNSPLGPLGVPGPSTFLPNVQIRMPAPNINTAQTQFWSLALQRELSRSTILELSYSGAHGVHLYDIENLNQTGGAQFYLGAPLTFGLTRENTQYSALNLRGSLGGSAYHSLNVKFQTQNLHNTGLSLIANYTWAHSLDDLSSTFSDNLQGGSGAIGSLGYLDPLHPKLDWGSSDFDIRNRFVVSPIWETPWFKGGHGVLHQAVGGWSVVGIVTVRSGIPFSVFDYTYDNNAYTVPRLVPGSPITNYHTGSPQVLGPNLFNVLTVPAPVVAPVCDPSVGCDPALGISDFGPFPANMTHRNAFRGPGAWNSDLALAKSFSVTERVKLEFRAEAFDLFNHHNLYVNTSNLLYSSDSAGTPPLQVTALKGGLGSIALGGNHDERRFGQFSIRVSF